MDLDTSIRQTGRVSHEEPGTSDRDISISSAP